MTTSSATHGRRPIQRAKQKTEKVREDLELAHAELHLTSTIFERELPPEQQTGDVRKAMKRNEAVAGNVADAKEELEQVEALLEQEIGERERLERELARRA
jgi:hypothetical protein